LIPCPLCGTCPSPPRPGNGSFATDCSCGALYAVWNGLVLMGSADRSVPEVRFELFDCDPHSPPGPHSPDGLGRLLRERHVSGTSFGSYWDSYDPDDVPDLILRHLVQAVIGS